MSQDALSSNVSLCDALDRILSQGVAVNGDIAISVAGVDLLYIGLRGLLCSVDALGELPESLRGASTRQFAEELTKRVEQPAPEHEAKLSENAGDLVATPPEGSR